MFVCVLRILTFFVINIVYIGFRRYGEGYIEPGTRILTGYPGTRVPVLVGYPGSITRQVFGITRTRTGSDRSGYYPSGTPVVDERVQLYSG